MTKHETVQGLLFMLSERESLLNEINQEIEILREEDNKISLANVLIEKYPVEKEVNVLYKTLELLEVPIDVIYGDAVWE